MLAGAVALSILIGIGALHAYWAAGGTVGSKEAIPMKDGLPLFRPTPLGTAFVALVLFAAAALIAAGIGWIPAHGLERPVRVGDFLIATVFLLRAVGDLRYVGFFKRVRGTRFARLDTFAYSPLCLLLAGLIAISAWR